MTITLVSLLASITLKLISFHFARGTNAKSPSTQYDRLSALALNSFYVISFLFSRQGKVKRV